MTESVKKFKAEMEQRGLFRKITVAVNLIPPPPLLFRLLFGRFFLKIYQFPHILPIPTPL